MSGYGARKDGEGWRSLYGPEPMSDENPDGLRPDEIYTETKPPDPVPAGPTVEELAVQAKEQRDKLLAIAANRMGPLQDAVDTDRATEEETARLVLWKGYRIDLNRIEEQATFPISIDWPLSPDEVPAEELPAE